VYGDKTVRTDLYEKVNESWVKKKS
jgi:hypothetical protein